MLPHPEEQNSRDGLQNGKAEARSDTGFRTAGGEELDCRNVGNITSEERQYN